MSKVYRHLKKMILLADDIGEVDNITMGEWLETSDRVYINGKTQDGREFTLTLEIEKEAKEDVV